MIAGCYDLHLYCDGIGCESGDYGQRGEGEFTGDETGARARARARKRGWKLFRDGRCLCGVCKSAGVQPAPLDDEPQPLTTKQRGTVQRLAHAKHVRAP